ncbi:MAG TPA: S24/S26 family peptidase [Candidatus Acidoferrales bacterium]|nr:S24/S26 family peptidase [Candidatus Acidoferrales bacterium]
MNLTAQTRTHLELAADLLQRGERMSLRVSGSSMLPSLFPGDVLTFRRCAPAEIVVGDIVLFMREGRCFVHRVEERMALGGDSRIRTRGDALPSCDAPVGETEVMGRLSLVERKGWRLQPPRLGPVRSLLAGVVRHSPWAARVLVAAQQRFWPAAEVVGPGRQTSK